jgi:hypothetical protein
MTRQNSGETVHATNYTRVIYRKEADMDHREHDRTRLEASLRRFLAAHERPALLPEPPEPEADTKRDRLTSV